MTFSLCVATCPSAFIFIKISICSSIPDWVSPGRPHLRSHPHPVVSTKETYWIGKHSAVAKQRNEFPDFARTNCQRGNGCSWVLPAFAIKDEWLLSPDCWAPSSELCAPRIFLLMAAVSQRFPPMHLWQHFRARKDFTARIINAIVGRLAGK